MQSLDLELDVIAGSIPLSAPQYRDGAYPVHQNLRFLRALCIALTQAQPLSCLGSSVVEHLPSKQCVVGSSPT